MILSLEGEINLQNTIFRGDVISKLSIKWSNNSMWDCNNQFIIILRGITTINS